VRSTGFSTGVAKKELSIIANLVVEKAAELDRDTFGVAVGGSGAVAAAARRDRRVSSRWPLAFGQFGEMGPGLEAPLASMAKRGADEMADRYLIENREAAVGVQMFHMRQRWGHLHRLFASQERDQMKDPRKRRGLSDTCHREPCSE
jgi:hypothetical protein